MVPLPSPAALAGRNCDGAISAQLSPLTAFAATKLFSSAFTSRIKVCVTIGGVRGERTISLSQVLCDQPVAVPVPSGQGGAEGVHGAVRPPRQRIERGPRPNRFPPQPVGRLPAELHRLLGL